MKNMKKIASVVLALVMTLALMVPAFATPATPLEPGNKTDDHPEVADITINIDKPEGATDSGEKYTVYKIFSASVAGEVYNVPSTNPVGTTSTFENISYTISKDSPFYDAVAGFKKGDNTVFVLTPTVNDPDTCVVTRNTVDGKEVDFDAADLATELKKVIDADNNETDADKKINWVGIKVVVNHTAPFQVENTGYYLILSSLGSKMVVDTIGKGDMNIMTKNDLPTLEKKILETVPATEVVPAHTDKVDSTTASYGDTVTFELAVKIPASAVGEMVVHDRMDSNLTYVGLTEDSFEAAVSDGDETGEGVTVCTKHFTISAEQVAAAVASIEEGKEDTTVYIRYTATLNSDAPTAIAIKNIANLTYSEYKTPDDEVEVYTYEFDLVKTKPTDENKTAEILKDAKFELYDAKTGGSKIELVKNEDGTYSVATDGQKGEDFTSAVIVAGHVTIKGLANGTYWLEETEAPAGYNKLAERVEVVIEDANRDADTNETDTIWQSGGIQVENFSGTELPSTGGIGTTIFYVVGGILVVAAAILLMTRKRMGSEQ